MQKADIHASVTASIIAAIEAGAGEFEMPWHRARGVSAINAQTTKRYRGINRVILWAAAAQNDYSVNEWATVKQWNALGGHVLPGSTGTTVIKYGVFKDKKVVDRTAVYLKAYAVFNRAQTNLPVTPADVPLTRLATPTAAVEAYVKNAGVSVVYGGDRAYYRPATDHVQMPDPALWTGTATSTADEACASTLLHEAVHWTGHHTRLARLAPAATAAEGYAAEELVAELGAATLCVSLGVSATPRPDHAAYCAAYLKALRGDKKFIFRAAAAAEKAVAYLDGRQPVNPSLTPGV